MTKNVRIWSQFHKRIASQRLLERNGIAGVRPEGAVCPFQKNGNGQNLDENDKEGVKHDIEEDENENVKKMW